MTDDLRLGDPVAQQFADLFRPILDRWADSDERRPLHLRLLYYADGTMVIEESPPGSEES